MHAFARRAEWPARAPPCAADGPARPRAVHGTAAEWRIRGAVPHPAGGGILQCGQARCALAGCRLRAVLAALTQLCWPLRLPLVPSLTFCPAGPCVCTFAAGLAALVPPQHTAQYSSCTSARASLVGIVVYSAGKEKLLFAAREGLRAVRGRVSLVPPEVTVEPVLLAGAMALLEQVGGWWGCLATC